MFETKISTGNKAQHKTLEEANAWLDRNIALNSFGKNDRWLLEENFDDETIETATDTRQVDGFYGPVTEYFFPANYTIDGPIDITDQYNAEQAKIERMSNGKAVRILCDNIMDSVIGFNMANGADTGAMVATFADILILLQAYRPFQAKPLIQAITVDETVTQEMKDEILGHYL